MQNSFENMNDGLHVIIITNISFCASGNKYKPDIFMYQSIPSLTIPPPGRGFAHSSCSWGVYNQIFRGEGVADGEGVAVKGA